MQMFIRILLVGAEKERLDFLQSHDLTEALATNALVMSLGFKVYEFNEVAGFADVRKRAHFQFIVPQPTHDVTLKERMMHKSIRECEAVIFFPDRDACMNISQNLKMDSFNDRVYDFNATKTMDMILNEIYASVKAENDEVSASIAIPVFIELPAKDDRSVIDEVIDVGRRVTGFFDRLFTSSTHENSAVDRRHPPLEKDRTFNVIDPSIDLDDDPIDKEKKNNPR